MSLTLTIYYPEGGKKKKGRAFSAEVFAYAAASGLWDSGSASSLRPVYLLLGATDEEAVAVLENLRAGERGTIKGDPGPASGTPIECMRSMGYVFAPQRSDEGTILTAYLPKLCDFHPGLLDADGVRFVLLPAREDLAAMPVGVNEHAAARQALARLRVPLDRDALRDLVPTALLWAEYLDARSELPIPPDPSFRIGLCLAALKDGIASLAVPVGKTADFGAFEHEPFGFRAYVAPHVALATGIATRATHATLASFLAGEIARYDRAGLAARRASSSSRTRERRVATAAREAR